MGQSAAKNPSGLRFIDLTVVGSSGLKIKSVKHGKTWLSFCSVRARYQLIGKSFYKMNKKNKKITGVKSKRSVRRSKADLRQDVLNLDGVFLNWKDKIEKEANNKTKQAIHEFNIIVEKGVLVFENGCILPHPHYSKKGDEGPARVKGYKASFNLFHTTFQQGDMSETNEDGWPVSNQISHLCHWNSCINPEHLILEERWKNWKRNYCSGCNCGMVPQCINKFHPSSWWKQDSNHPKKFGYEKIADLKRVLPKHLKLLPKNHFLKEDRKSENRRMRKKRGSKHILQSKRKKLKKL